MLAASTLDNTSAEALQSEACEFSGAAPPTVIQSFALKTLGFLYKAICRPYYDK